MAKLINSSTPNRSARFAFSALLTSMLTVTGCMTLTTPQESPAANMVLSDEANRWYAAMPAQDLAGYLAYVDERGNGAAKISRLSIMHPDGSEGKVIMQLQGGSVFAPSWSKDGKYLLFNAQPNRSHVRIYRYSLADGSLDAIVPNAGSHLSPALSTDGRRLLYSASVEGNADIYEVTLADGQIQRLTRANSTEVQPSYASDDQSVILTSDRARAGRPELYLLPRQNASLGTLRKLSQGGYAASAQLGSDGETIGYLRGTQAALLNIKTGQGQSLMDTGVDEPARLSPSGAYAVFPQKISPQSGVIVMQDLRNNQRFSLTVPSAGVIRAVSWGGRAVL